jgi:hypothetical protein
VISDRTGFPRYTVKRVKRFSRSQPSRDVTNLTFPAWLGIIKLFTAKENLVSDIPAGSAGAGKSLTFFTVYAREINNRRRIIKYSTIRCWKKD